MDMPTTAEPLPTRTGMPPVPPAMSPEMDRLARDFRQFIADCEALLKNAQSLSSEGATIAKAELSRKMADARVKITELRTAAGERAAHARGATEEYVRREPFKSVMIAAAVGALVALIVARR
jgi:ElaB/YqjD/DUF883 family membrane-anchored ribosome-binding protein